MEEEIPRENIRKFFKNLVTEKDFTTMKIFLESNKLEINFNETLELLSL